MSLSLRHESCPPWSWLIFDVSQKMEDRAARLLGMEDATLFRAGGCHVFALALREKTNLPLLWIHGDCGSHDHIACRQEEIVVDYFGWFSRAEYRRAGMVEHLSLQFDPIEEEVVRSRFILGDGPGYYAHPDFLVPATARAQSWIQKHQDVFDGVRRIAIPGVSRVEIAGQNEIEALFGPKG